MLDPRFSYTIRTIRTDKDVVRPVWTRWAAGIGFLLGVALVLWVLHMFLEAL